MYAFKRNFSAILDLSTSCLGKKILLAMGKVKSSKLDEMIAVAKTLDRHEKQIFNWFMTNPRVSNGIVEGFNNKAKLTMRKAYGFKQYRTIQVALYHQLGELPEPFQTHKYF